MEVDLGLVAGCRRTSSFRACTGGRGARIRFIGRFARGLAHSSLEAGRVEESAGLYPRLC